MKAALRDLRDRALTAWLRRDLADALGPAMWCLDRAIVEDGRLRIAGWVVRPDTAAVTFTLNGRPFAQQRIAGPRPDLVPIFGHVADVSDAVFEGETELLASERAGDTVLEIHCADPATGRPWRPQQAYYLPPRSAERWPLPDGPRMVRVHGASADTFRIIGCSNARKIADAVRRHTGQDIETRRRVLDWGCGSGRLLRYLDRVPAGALTGVDVDADNIAWCRAHLPFAAFESIPLHPPTAFASRTFDTIVGISIFTHLTEAVQHEWLAELHRIATPDAVLLMTIHGPAATVASGSIHAWRKVREAGFLDAVSHDMDGVLPDTEYYRTTYHSPEYIRREWARTFEILEIVPAAIGNLQDLVVMRPRS